MNSSVATEIRQQVERILRAHPVTGGPLTTKAIFDQVDCANEVAEVADALRALSDAGLATRAGAYGWRIVSSDDARPAPATEKPKKATTPRNSSEVEAVKVALRQAFGSRAEPWCFRDVVQLMPGQTEPRLRWVVQDLKEREEIESAGMGHYRFVAAPKASADSGYTPNVEPVAEIKLDVEFPKGVMPLSTVAEQLSQHQEAEMISAQVRAVAELARPPAHESLGPRIELMKLDGGGWWVKARDIAGCDIELTGPADVAFAVASLLLQRAA